MAGIHNALAGSGDGYIPLALTISSNTSNYVLDTSKVAGYVPGRTRLTLTVASGVQISSASAAAPAFQVDSSWQAGDIIEIVNNGSIGGAGGAGGAGSNPQGGIRGVSNPPSSGQAGGAGFATSFPVRFTNNGTIGGGGGGGGGSSGWMYSGTGDPDTGYWVGGYPGRNGGSIYAGPALGYTSDFDIPGYETWPGGRYRRTHRSGGGGAAGQAGQAGTNEVISGAWPGYAHGTGGAAGAAVVGNSNITWLATGTRIGPIT